LEAFLVSLIFLIPIKDINIKGISPGIEKKLESLKKEYRGREANKENLNNLTEKLTHFFLKEGYPLARIRFTNFEKEKDSLKIVISVSNLKPFIVNDILIDNTLQTKKYIFKRYFDLTGKPFTLDKFMRGKRKIERFSFINIRSFDLRSYAGRNYLYLKVYEKPSSNFEIFSSYDNKSKILKGKIEIEALNLFGDLRSFKIRWERYTSGKADFEMSYTEPFIGPFEVSLSPYYLLFQRESLYIKENLGIRLIYHFEGGNFSILYDYYEETPFLKNPFYVNSNGSEFVFGKKPFFPEEGAYFRFSGKVLKSKNISYKGKANIFFMKKIVSIFYSSAEIYSGFLNLKDSLLSEYFYLGGTKYPRGYSEEDFVSESFITFIFEEHIRIKNISFFSFLDHSIMRLISEDYIHKSGYGIGFIGFTENLEVKLSLALPYKEGLNSAKVHFILRNYF